MGKQKMNETAVSYEMTAQEAPGKKSRKKLFTIIGAAVAAVIVSVLVVVLLFSKSASTPENALKMFEGAVRSGDSQGMMDVLNLRPGDKASAINDWKKDPASHKRIFLEQKETMKSFRVRILDNAEEQVFDALENSGIEDARDWKRTLKLETTYTDKEGREHRKQGEVTFYQWEGKWYIDEGMQGLMPE